MKTLKKITLITFIGICLLGCSKDGEVVQQNSLLGSWQLAQIYTNSGAGAGSWKDVEDGYIYTFSSNGDFSSTRFDECTYGTFSSEFDLLTLDYGCDGFTTNIEDPQGSFVEKFAFDSGFLLLNPTYLTCDEGCGFKFRKIAD